MSNFGVWYCPDCEAVLLFDEEQSHRCKTGAIETRFGDGRLYVRCVVCSTDMHKVPEAALAAFDALKAQRRRAATERLGNK